MRRRRPRRTPNPSRRPVNLHRVELRGDGVALERRRRAVGCRGSGKGCRGSGGGRYLPLRRGSFLLPVGRRGRRRRVSAVQRRRGPSLGPRIRHSAALHSAPQSAPHPVPHSETRRRLPRRRAGRSRPADATLRRRPRGEGAADPTGVPIEVPIAEVPSPRRERARRPPPRRVAVSRVGQDATSSTHPLPSPPAAPVGGSLRPRRRRRVRRRVADLDPTSAFIFVARFAGSDESGARAAVPYRRRRRAVSRDRRARRRRRFSRGRIGVHANRRRGRALRGGRALRVRQERRRLLRASSTIRIEHPLGMRRGGFSRARTHAGLFGRDPRALLRKSQSSRPHPEEFVRGDVPNFRSVRRFRRETASYERFGAFADSRRVGEGGTRSARILLVRGVHVRRLKRRVPTNSVYRITPIDHTSTSYECPPPLLPANTSGAM